MMINRLNKIMLTLWVLTAHVVPAASSGADQDGVLLDSGKRLVSGVILAEDAVHDLRPLPFRHPSNRLIARDLNQLIVNHMDGRSALVFSWVSPQAFRLVLNRNRLKIKRGVTDEAILEVIKDGNNLESLELNDSDVLTEKTLMSIGMRCKNLKSLSLFNKSVSSLCFIDFVKNNPHLSDFDLTGCVALTPESIMVLSGRPNLKKLILPDHMGTDLLLQALGTSGEQIEELGLPSSPGLTNVAMEAIGAGCPNLRYLNLTSCGALGDDGITNLARCRKMEALFLGGCTQLTNRSVIVLAGACHSLKQLILWGNKRVTDEAVFAIAKGCPRLMYVNLRECELLTNRSLMALLGGCRDLTHVDMANCVLLNVESFAELKGPITNKLSLDLSGCPLMTDEGVRQMTMKIPHLYSLNLSNCFQITDHTARRLAMFCHELERIFLDNCGQITDASVSLLTTENCPKLRLKSFFDNPKITLKYDTFCGTKGSTSSDHQSQ